MNSMVECYSEMGQIGQDVSRTIFYKIFIILFSVVVATTDIATSSFLLFHIYRKIVTLRVQGQSSNQYSYILCLYSVDVIFCHDEITLNNLNNNFCAMCCVL